MSTYSSTLITRMLSMRLAIALLGICLLGLGPATARAEDVVASGTWRSTRDPDKAGTWKLNATKSASDEIDGGVIVVGQPSFNDGNIFGTMDSTGHIHFGVVYNLVEEAVFDGATTSGVVSGTFTTRDGDEGTWTGGIGQ